MSIQAHKLCLFPDCAREKQSEDRKRLKFVLENAVCLLLRADFTEQR